MPRTSERGGPQTRARISQVATALMLSRGFDEVTVAQVALEAGVSSVTVFKHFPRKEDLLLDRAPEAAELLRAAVREAVAGTSGDADASADVDAGGIAAADSSTVVARAIDALETLSDRLASERHALSGLAPGSAVFFRVVAGSPSLAGRSREIAAELEAALADELERAGAEREDAVLVAALFLAGYASVLVETARRVIDGAAGSALAADHRARLDRLFAALRGGLLRP
ncbi:TetR/AcrR family transcriptional regulator [Cnuibacter physcomitrellae]|uniref:TetR/AcrR family transcriptional regulator n=1 Tax=Cnuibacter physcomitrellae TaxID=1619308 RepID=UPI002175A7F5|nr:TetR/AcrR family transcriptional regulator [Cnuibacter physcomitrellae]MCS5498117.1 TetR/AcrR family transcriptional regulator [Cnuibacter physcomitrellae]